MSGSSHEHFMQQCIELAWIAKARGESPVGSVIVHGDAIIAKGIEGSKAHRDITFHAEIEAIRQATASLQSQDLAACVLYTTHEPCIMCSYVIRHTKINMVVAGLTTGEMGGYSSHLPVLRDDSVKKWGAAPVFLSGVLEAACRALHSS